MPSESGVILKESIVTDMESWSGKTPERESRIVPLMVMESPVCVGEFVDESRVSAAGTAAEFHIIKGIIQNRALHPIQPPQADMVGYPIMRYAGVIRINKRQLGRNIGG